MTRIALLALLLAAAPVAAQQAPDSAHTAPDAPHQAPDPGPLPPRLSVAEAIARATADSHRLGELQARQAAAGAVVDQREAAQNPIVSTQVGYQRTNHVDEFGFATPTGFEVIYPDVPDNYRTRLELQWPIYTGGRLQALERAARAEATATGYDLAAARADLKLEVTRAFWALVTAREAARVVGEALKRVDAQLADVRSRFDAGFVPPNDVLTVEAQRARQQFLAIEAQNAAAIAEADLARLVGAPGGARIELDAALDDAPTPDEALAAAHAEAPDAAPLVGEARESRKDRAALATRIERPPSGSRPRPPAGSRRCPSSPAPTTRGRTRASFRARTPGSRAGTSASTCPGRLGRRTDARRRRRSAEPRQRDP